MNAVWYRFRAELRTRWRATLGLALLVGIAGGAALGAVAGAGRTDAAYSRLIADAITLIVVVSIVLATLIAAFPARSAARTRPAVVLRSE